MTKDCCVFTRGEFLLSDWKCDDCDPFCTDQSFLFKNLGNVVQCTVNISSEIVGTENKFNPLKDTSPRENVTGVSLSLSISCASVANLRTALYSEDVSQLSGTKTQTTFIRSLSEGDFIPFEKKGVNQETLTVKLKDSYGLLNALVLNSDYRVDESGITIAKDNIDLSSANGIVLEYNYDESLYFVVDFFKKSIGYKTLYFKGINYGEDESQLFDAVFHKVIFAPMQSFELLPTDSFFTINLNAKVEREADKDWFKLIKKVS